MVSAGAAVEDTARTETPEMVPAYPVSGVNATAPVVVVANPTE